MKSKLQLQIIMAKIGKFFSCWVMAIFILPFLMLVGGTIHQFELPVFIGAILLGSIVGLGFAGYMSARRKETLVRRYRLLVTLLGNRNSVNFNDYAEFCGITLTAAVKDIKDMLQKKFFNKVEVDFIDKIITFIPYETDDTSIKEVPMPMQKPKVIICKSCGATCHIKPNEQSVCDYCGSCV
jgi:hypothetical protein